MENRTITKTTNLDKKEDSAITSVEEADIKTHLTIAEQLRFISRRFTEIEGKITLGLEAAQYYSENKTTFLLDWEIVQCYITFEYSHAQFNEIKYFFEQAMAKYAFPKGCIAECLHWLSEHGSNNTGNLSIESILSSMVNSCRQIDHIDRLLFVIENERCSDSFEYTEVKAEIDLIQGDLLTERIENNNRKSRPNLEKYDQASLQDARNLFAAISSIADNVCCPYLTSTRYIHNYVDRRFPEIRRLVITQPTEIYPFLFVKRQSHDFSLILSPPDILKELKDCFCDWASRLNRICFEQKSYDAALLRELTSNLSQEIIGHKHALSYVQSYSTSRFLTSNNPENNKTYRPVDKRNVMAAIISFLLRRRSDSIQFSMQTQEVKNSVFPFEAFSLLITRKEGPLDQDQLFNAELLRLTTTPSNCMLYDWPASFDIAKAIDLLDFTPESSLIFSISDFSSEGQEIVSPVDQSWLLNDKNAIFRQIQDFINQHNKEPWLKIEGSGFEAHLPILSVGTDWTPRIVCKLTNPAAAGFVAKLFVHTSLYCSGGSLAGDVVRDTILSRSGIGESVNDL
jgi:hypothetical protein